MKFYLAPLEGLTTYVYRNVYHHFFHPMDKYFTPFIVPHPNRGFKPKELKEILPSHIYQKTTLGLLPPLHIRVLI